MTTTRRRRTTSQPEAMHRRWLRAIVGWVARVLFVDGNSIPDHRHRTIHRTVLVLAALLFIGGFLLARTGGPELQDQFPAILGPLMIIGSVALLLGETVASVQYGFPIPQEAIRRGMWANRRIITPVAVAILHGATLVSPEALILVREPLVPMPLKIVAFVLLIGCALPFWMIVTAPLRWWRRDAQASFQGDDSGTNLRAQEETA